MTIGDKIYELRNSHNMSLREFAKLTGVTHTTIARLEGTSFVPQKIYLDTLYQICKSLNYDFAEFLTETGYIKPNNTKDQTTVTPMGDGLSSEERNIIDDYRSLNSECQKLVKSTIKTLLTSSAGSKSKTHG